MNAFLHFLIQNTLAGTVLIMAALLLRKATSGLSKLYVRALWLLVLAVLLLPPLPLGPVQTARGLISGAPAAFWPGEAAPGTAADHTAQKKTSGSTSGKASASPAQTGTASADRDGQSVENIAPRYGAQEKAASPAFAQEKAGPFTGALFALWAGGAAFLAAGSLLQWLRLKRSVKDAVKIRPDVYSSTKAGAPFVMPGLPPRIYIPAELTAQKEQLQDILAHERQHIKNHDPLMKCAALPVLFLHWFNPLVWLALRLMNRDLEMYCDECVLRHAAPEQRQHYAQTLLDSARKKSGFLPAVYFGESSTKSRICHILNMKSPRGPIKLLLVLFILVCGFSFLITGNAAERVAQNGTSTGQAPMIQDKNDQSQRQLPAGEVSYRAGDRIQAADDGAEHAADDSGNADTAPDEEKFWADQTVVGDGDTGIKPGFDLSKEASLLGGTAQFALYGVNDADAVVVEVPDGARIYAEIPYTSTYDVPPALLEHDFDDDGENELAVITYVMHGTGVSIRTLFMADHTSDGSWKLFHYRDSDYIADLTPHFGTSYEKDGVRLLFDGVPTGTAEQVAAEELDNKYGYYAGSQIDFRFIEGSILLRAGLTGYSKINHAGEFPGHELDADVRYLGEGRWALTDIRYADANINDLIEEAVPLYLAGHVDEVMEAYAVPGLKLDAPDIESENAVVLSLSYSAKELEHDTADVHVSVRTDASESPIRLIVPLRRVALDFGGMWWRIAGKIIGE